MIARTCSLTALSALVLLLGMVGCRSTSSTVEGLLSNPSFHVLVNDEHPVPATGTFSFDTKLFKINHQEGVDLAVVDERITKAIQNELERRGYRHVDSSPDMMVSYAVALDSALSGSDLNDAYGDEAGIDFPVPVGHEGMDYHQGALIVDFVSDKSRQLLWRGAIMADVSMEVSEREKDLRVRYGVKALLEQFPRPGQNGAKTSGN